jgi:hypothetical protein
VDDRASRRDPGAGWGAAVFAAWLLLVASGFWNLVAIPMREAAAAALDPAQAAVVERWARSAVVASGRRLLVDPQACACGTPARTALLDRMRDAGVGVLAVDVDAARLPLRPEVVLLDADGRLRYAGPATPTLFCTAGRHAVEAALRAPPHAPALVLPADCRCETG